MNQQIILADVGNEHIGRTRTYLTVTDSHPVGSFSIKVSTVYSKAKDPEAHLTKFLLHVENADKLRNIADFLTSCVPEDAGSCQNYKSVQGWL